MHNPIAIQDPRTSLDEATPEENTDEDNILMKDKDSSDTGNNHNRKKAGLRAVHRHHRSLSDSNLTASTEKSALLFYQQTNHKPDDIVNDLPWSLENGSIMNWSDLQVSVNDSRLWSSAPSEQFSSSPVLSPRSESTHASANTIWKDDSLVQQPIDAGESCVSVTSTNIPAHNDAELIDSNSSDFNDFTFDGLIDDHGSFSLNY